MKKKIALLSALLMAATVVTAGCSEQKTDWEYIEDKGTLVIGYTLFAPMNYEDSSGELIGFETEFAKAVCEELGITATFQLIDWNSKVTELNSKSIDCIWNGMTIDDERKEQMGITVPYMQNKQVMVVKKDMVEHYSDIANIAGAKVVAEQDSAGETVAKTDDTFKDAAYTAVSSQATAVMEVESGTADIAIIDYIMSIGTIGEGTSYTDLAITSLDFNDEEYGIAFRKEDTELLAKVNEAIQKVADSGKLNEIGEKYKIADAILVNPAN